MEKPVQWMTLQELRDELDTTRPAWEAAVGIWKASLLAVNSQPLAKTRADTGWFSTSC